MFPSSLPQQVLWLLQAVTWVAKSMLICWVVPFVLSGQGCKVTEFLNTVKNITVTLCSVQHQAPITCTLFIKHAVWHLLSLLFFNGGNLCSSLLRILYCVTCGGHICVHTCICTISILYLLVCIVCDVCNITTCMNLSPISCMCISDWST